ncbi:hypothetical protein SOVF_116920 [Spinacia oleracea]|nr:hypothetical protein SOVF_116920 [Spinacia oleracea]
MSSTKPFPKYWQRKLRFLKIYFHFHRFPACFPPFRAPSSSSLVPLFLFVLLLPHSCSSSCPIPWRQLSSSALLLFLGGRGSAAKHSPVTAHTSPGIVLLLFYFPQQRRCSSSTD